MISCFSQNKKDFYYWVFILFLLIFISVVVILVHQVKLNKLEILPCQLDIVIVIVYNL